MKYNSDATYADLMNRLDKSIESTDSKLEELDSLVASLTAKLKNLDSLAKNLEK